MPTYGWMEFLDELFKIPLKKFPKVFIVTLPLDQRDIQKAHSVSAIVEAFYRKTIIEHPWPIISSRPLTARIKLFYGGLINSLKNHSRFNLKNMLWL